MSLRSVFPLRRLVAAAAMCLLFPLTAGLAQAVHRGPGLSTEGETMLLDGKPFKVLSGEMHYARIPPEYWRTRMKMAKAMGLNTIATYVFWNTHEPEPGKYDFSGQYDLRAFLKTAQEEGLYVMLRSGPYSCAEWELGGFPAWLLKTPESAKALRSNDPLFMGPAERWIGRLAQEVEPMLYDNGGPVIAVQMENEYGNFGNDRAYLDHLHQVYLATPFAKSFLYTADNWRNIPEGQMPGVFAATNFGIGNHAGGMDALAKERPGQALFVSEYWPGWFDHWGHPHETRPIGPQIEDLSYILKRGAGINIYMFHGGTSFGYWSGSSWTNKQFLPDVTSYDYDAPLDEAGHPTAKYFAYREVLKEYASGPLPEPPPVAPVVKVKRFALAGAGPLLANLPAPIASETIEPMEAVGQSLGYILYRTNLPASAGAARLKLDELHDFAQVYLDGKLAGELDRRNEAAGTPWDEMTLPPHAGTARLDLLVANDGRINTQGIMRTENKGITRQVLLDGKALRGWEIYPLPLDGSGHLKPVVSTKAEAGFYVGEFGLSKVGDVFLDVRELGKGALWINGHAVGRFWNAGPQDTLYVPGPWLRKGRNEVLVFDLEARPGPPPRLAGLPAAVLNGPTKAKTGSRQE